MSEKIQTLHLKKSYSDAAQTDTKDKDTRKLQTNKRIWGRYHEFPSREIVRPLFKEQTELFYGIIAYSIFDCKWLVAKSKYSPAFYQIIKGDYRKADLHTLLSQLRWEEWQKLLYLNAHVIYFDQMYKNIIPFFSLKDLVYAKEIFLRNGHEFNKFKLSPEILSGNEEVWKFPSGAARVQEKPQEAALRNFKHITKQNIQHHSNAHSKTEDMLFLGKEPFCEYRINTQSKKEEHHYWMMVYTQNTPKIYTSDKEPYLLRWCTAAELEELLPESSKKILHLSKNFLRKNV